MKKFNVTVNGKAYAVEVEEVGANQGAFTYQPVQQPVQVEKEPASRVEPAPQVAPVKKVQSDSTEGETISAPMPGTILDVKVSEGQSVKSGDILFILEAMKMENEIVSPKDGVINKIYISKSATVSTGDSLVTIG
ncbi:MULTISPECIES: biotin/lipoyl-containing protein [unclassified Sedimentibacter]|uniref:biotin/lipoyl-containing protein n=1 Tax=unclassified Sedimentibacter TaxID=2649220 RepID=UPI0027DEE65F|nr:biotin/lipoyl-containing protein [Sedimentibacter sp. MB35-C1]WMJ76703.1 biotin/lipoyl-containing protein [Sedimentibacter sp. MB35-C1]